MIRRMGSDRIPAKYLNNLIYKKHNRRATTMCWNSLAGTGEIIKSLSEDYDVSGLEISTEMLKLANERGLPWRLIFYQAEHGDSTCHLRRRDHLRIRFHKSSAQVRDWKKLFQERAETSQMRVVFFNIRYGTRGAKSLRRNTWMRLRRCVMIGGGTFLWFGPLVAIMDSIRGRAGHLSIGQKYFNNSNNDCPRPATLMSIIAVLPPQS